MNYWLWYLNTTLVITRFDSQTTCTLKDCNTVHMLGVWGGRQVFQYRFTAGFVFTEETFRLKTTPKQTKNKLCICNWNTIIVHKSSCGCRFLATALLNEWSIIHFELFLDISELFLGLHSLAIVLAQLNFHLIRVSLYLLLDPHSIILAPHRSGCSAWSQSPFGYSSWFVPFFSANILSASLLTSTFIWNWTPRSLDSSYALWFSCQGTLYIGYNSINQFDKIHQGDDTIDEVQMLWFTVVYYIF